MITGFRYGNFIPHKVVNIFYDMFESENLWKIDISDCDDNHV